MALNLGNVSAYLDQLSQPLMHKALLQGVTNKYIKIIPNVFSQVSINLIDQSSPFSTSVVADNLTNLGFTDAGSATTTQVNITVCPLKFQQQYPIYAQGGIETTYLMYLYDAQRLKGSYHDTIPTFEEKWTDMLIKYINQQVDTTEWIGSYAPTFSGFTGNAHSGDRWNNWWLRNLSRFPLQFDKHRKQRINNLYDLLRNTKSRKYCKHC